MTLIPAYRQFSIGDLQLARVDKRGGVGTDLNAMANPLYADVEYLGSFYLDAEFIEGKWYSGDHKGGCFPFESQRLVNLQNGPLVERRHPPEKAGLVR